MKLFSIFLLIILCDRISAQMNHDEVSRIIEEVRVNYAPDKRTSLFDISFTLDDKTLHLSGETNLPEAKNKLMSLLQDFNVNDLIVLLPIKKHGNKNFGVVNVSVANIRTKPAHSAELASQVLLGSNLKVLKSLDEWFLVQCEDDYIGWLDDDGLTLMDDFDYSSWNESEKVIVTNPFTFVFSENKLASQTISDVVVGNLLKKLSSGDDFTQVEFPDGRSGFILSNQVIDYYLWINSRVQAFSEIFRTASQMMGVPYLWGGTSVKGLDCSGFTKLVFQLNGVLLPRDASQQVYTGDLVDTQNGFDNLQLGDLLFFGKVDTVSGKERITHVAIYIGDLDFIHAAGRVRINSFDNGKENFAEDRLKSFIRAKRIFTSLGKHGVRLLKGN